MNTKDTILDAGIKVFAKYGFDKASVEDIAKMAKTAKGTLYYHFASKDEILEAITEAGIDNFTSTLKNNIGNEKDPVKRIEIVVETQLDFFFEYRDFCRILLSEIWRFEKKWKKFINNIQDQYLTIIKEIIRDGIEAGKFNPELDTEAATIAIFGLISFASIDWAIFHSKKPKTQMIKTIKLIFANGLLPQSDNTKQ